MSDKFIYHNARVKSMELKLLNAQQVQRLADADCVRDFAKILSEMGFGAGAGEGAGVDRMIESEEAFALHTLREFNEDNELDAVILERDYLNLKILLKALFSGGKTPSTEVEGVMSRDALAAGVGGDYSALRPEMANAVLALEKAAQEGKLTAHGVDCACDRAYFADAAALAKRNSVLADYLVLRADTSNISAFLRCRRQSLPERQFEENFMPDGSLEKEFFTSVYDAAPEAFYEKCRYTPYSALVAVAAEKGLVAFEAKRDNTLIAYWRERRDDMFSCAPVVGWYFGKLQELKVVKLLYAGVKNGVEPAVIKERTRDIYGA